MVKMNEIVVTPENWGYIKREIEIVQSILVYITESDVEFIVLAGNEEQYKMELRYVRELAADGRIPSTILGHLRSVGIL